MTESIPTAGARLAPRTPQGLDRTCRGWEQEGALRCLLNNLDPAVAERADELVVYGGTGKAARNHECLEAIVGALKDLGNAETLIVQSGRPVAVLPTHPDAPRVLISSAMLVPAWSTPEDFWALEAAGLTMYGQMTAGGWFYIGTQGILGFTYETFAAVARTHFDGTLAGRRVLTAGLGGMGGAQGLGVALNGGRVLAVEVDPRRARRRTDAGWIDLLTDDYRHAIALLDDPRGPAAIALIGNAAEIVPRLVRDGIAFDVVTDQTAAHDLLHGYVPAGYSVAEAERAAAGDASYLDAVRSSIARHVEGLLELRAHGAVAFEYGNNLRAQAREAGVVEAMEIPGFVAAYVRPLLAQGIGPYRWIALSGDPEDLRFS
ncbi:MAG: urocanate hydratase [Solirubrobacteraceae bacterium]